jgi:hypothetical protein
MMRRIPPGVLGTRTKIGQSLQIFNSELIDFTLGEGPPAEPDCAMQNNAKRKLTPTRLGFQLLELIMGRLQPPLGL